MYVIPYLALFMLTSATVAGISNLFLGMWCQRIPSRLNFSRLALNPVPGGVCSPSQPGNV